MKKPSEDVIRMDWFYEPILLRGSDYDASYLAGIVRFYAESTFLTNNTKFRAVVATDNPILTKTGFATSWTSSSEGRGLPRNRSISFRTRKNPRSLRKEGLAFLYNFATFLSD